MNKLTEEFKEFGTFLYRRSVLRRSFFLKVLQDLVDYKRYETKIKFYHADQSMIQNEFELKKEEAQLYTMKDAFTLS